MELRFPWIRKEVLEYKYSPRYDQRHTGVDEGHCGGMDRYAGGYMPNCILCQYAGGHMPIVSYGFSFYARRPLNRVMVTLLSLRV